MSHKNELFEKLFQLQKLIDKLTKNGILKEKSKPSQYMCNR